MALASQYDLIRVVTLHATVMASGSLTYLVGCGGAARAGRFDIENNDTTTNTIVEIIFAISTILRSQLFGTTAVFAKTQSYLDF